MEMIPPVLFASFLLIITAVAQDLRSCYSVTMDAWTVFSKPHRFDMHQRNYNYSYGGKDSLCVRIRAEPSTIVRNTVTKNFTYLNMSSSPPRRPSALINITFLEYAPERETKITYIHPKIVATTPGYSVAPPSWNFLFVAEYCFVVALHGLYINECERSANRRSGSNSILNHDSCFKERCELWVRGGHVGIFNLGKWRNDIDCCQKFFNQTCATSTVVQVYHRQICRL
uniref:Lipocalin n=1 Tax=Rhipicephalus appendiculatus TaxID=34631 RepID=A0A131YPV3_RHIAP